jgi:hypothetical protein
MAQHRAGARGQHRGHEPPIAREQRVAHREHAAMDPVQRTARHAMIDRTGPEPEAGKLMARDHAVLARSQPGDRPIEVRVTFSLKYRENVNVGSHGQILARPASRFTTESHQLPEGTPEASKHPALADWPRAHADAERRRHGSLC